jgi:hypothetical protein
MKMLEEFWVVGGRYRDTSFTDLEEGAAEAYGPFARYDDALRTWSSHSSRTRAYASVRYSVVTTVKAPNHAERHTGRPEARLAAR